MTSILGISAFYHDSAAALVIDGEIVAAAQEERFSRKKHDASFPARSIEYCLREGGVRPESIDFVGFYEKPLLKFERLLETYLAYAPLGFQSFMKAIPLWIHQKLHLPSIIHKGLGGKYGKQIVFPSHHESHAASAFYPSPFPEAAILTVDGVGEWATACLGVGRDREIELLGELSFPHSLGLLYSAFTYHCGFRVNSGEYKLMGLAPYGEPEYAEAIRRHLIDLKEDGSFRLDMSYFRYAHGLRMTSEKFSRLFGGPPRRPETPITQREMNLAASVQKVTEEIMLKMAWHAHRTTRMRKLCLAGGVALNCVGNGRIVREGPFEEIWIQPAAGDAGGALGTALFIWHQLLEKPRTVSPEDAQKGSLLGPKNTEEEILRFLDDQNASYEFFDDEEALCETVASLLNSGQIVGWSQGRMEFGPRALGSRSILGDARNAAMQKQMNLKIKFRESFRPFAPAVLRERAHEFFEWEAGRESPYMLLVSPIRERYRRSSEGDGNAATEKGLARLKRIRSEIPAVTHVDYSARIQTVDPLRHGRFHRLLQTFERRTGCPILINTSFNVRGEPIVCTAKDAYDCFMATNIDALVLEKYLLLKEQQSDKKDHRIESYLDRFELD